MATIEIWSSKPVKGSEDIVELSYNEDFDRYAILTTDCGRSHVVLLNEEDVMRLAHHLFCVIQKKLEDFAEKAAAEMTEEYEKSEKDCMWERE